MTGRRVLMFFVAFFLVIIVVNGIFMVAALRTHKGVVTENAYEEGLKFETPADQKADEDLPKVDDEFVWNGDVLQWRIRDPEGQGVRFAKAFVTLQPVGDNTTQTPIRLDLNANGHGVYQTTIEGLDPGEWSVVGNAKFGINKKRINHVNQTQITVK